MTNLCCHEESWSGIGMVSPFTWSSRFPWFWRIKLPNSNPWNKNLNLICILHIIKFNSHKLSRASAIRNNCSSVGWETRHRTSTLVCWCTRSNLPTWLKSEATFDPSPDLCDTIIWTRTVNGEDSSKSAYEMQFWREHHLAVNFFIRSLLQNWLLTSDRLLLRGWPNNSTSAVYAKEIKPGDCMATQIVRALTQFTVECWRAHQHHRKNKAAKQT